MRKSKLEAGETALRLNLLADDPDLVPSTHLELQFQGDLTPSSGLRVHYKYVEYIHKHIYFYRPYT